MSNLIQDLKFSLRTFRRQPVFIGVVVLTLALGIGANTAVFSVVNGVLLQPLEYEESERLLGVWGRFDPESGFDFPRFVLSPPEWVDYRAQNTTLAGVAAFTTSSTTLTGGDADPERVTTVLASHDLFEVLREEPFLGRAFNAEEDRNDERVVVLEHGFWQTRFGGDPALVGRTIRLDGEPWVVIGVMPDGFEFVRGAEMWLPLGVNPDQPGNRQSHFLRAVGRLADGVTLQEVEAELDALMAAWEQEYPEIHKAHYLFVSRLIDDVVGSVRSALWMLLAASGLILLIVCANVASVLLARGEDRTREIAIRGALGAGRGRIVRLLLSESLLLSVLGGAIGVALAVLGVELLMRAAAGAIPRADAVAVDVTVLGFAGVVTVLTAVLFGLAPTLQVASGDPQRHLKEGASHHSASRARLYFRRGLVVAEVALSFLLVLSAGLVLKGFNGMLATDPGFETENVLIAGLSLPLSRYEGAGDVQSFYRQLLARVDGLPGVSAASAATTVPMASGVGFWDFRVEGEALPGDGEPAWNAQTAAVRPGYFEALRIPLLRGRTFTAADTGDAQLVTIVNRALVDRFFGGIDPLGKRIAVCCAEEGQETPWMSIVGVVDNARYAGLDADAPPTYYIPHDQGPVATYGSTFRALTVIVRTDVEPRRLAGSVRGIVAELDDDIPIVDLRTMDAVVADSVARPRFTSRLLGLFALIAMALGATGIYGVLAYMVAQRAREIGIRKALGAPPGGLAAMVIAQGMALVGLGLIIGAAASLWVGSQLEGLLFGVSHTDPGTYAMVTGALAVVALAACCIPTLRAVRVDPLDVMRAE